MWIGSIDTATTEPQDARPLGALRGLVQGLRDEIAPEGETGWALLRGQGPHGPVMVSCLSRLAAIQAPDHDQHVALSVPYTDRTDEGWPGADTLNALQGFEDHLIGIVKGSGQLVAAETSNGTRTMHFYVDSGTPAAGQLQAAARDWNQGTVRVVATADPSWQQVADFRL